MWRRSLLSRRRRALLHSLLLLRVPLLQVLSLLLVTLLHLLPLRFVGLRLCGPGVLLVLPLLQLLVLLLLLLVQLLFLLLIPLVRFGISARRKLGAVGLRQLVRMNISRPVARAALGPRVWRTVSACVWSIAPARSATLVHRSRSGISSAVRGRIVVPSAPCRDYAAAAETAWTRRRRDWRPAMILRSPQPAIRTGFLPVLLLRRYRRDVSLSAGRLI